MESTVTVTSLPTLHSSRPWRWYKDPEHFQLERLLVLRTAWHYVRSVEQPTESGRTTAVTLAGVPILLANERGVAVAGAD
jgi:hypothetical protein